MIGFLGYLIQTVNTQPIYCRFCQWQGAGFPLWRLKKLKNLVKSAIFPGKIFPKREFAPSEREGLLRPWILLKIE